MPKQAVRRRERRTAATSSTRGGEGAEFRRYFEIIRRRWLIVITTLVVSGGATLFLVLPQPKVYEAKGTFVVVPRATDAEESLQAFDTLIRGGAINSTYASIAASNLVRRRAEARLDPALDLENATVSADVQTGTNILTITVQSLDPESAQRLAYAVGSSTISYVAALNEAYRLQPLDLPEVPDAPVGPKKILTAGIGMVLGILLGVGLAVAVDFVLAQFSRTPDKGDDLFDDAGTEDEGEAEVSVLHPPEPEANGRAADFHARHFRGASERGARKPPPPPPAGPSAGFRVAVERSVWCP